MDYLKRTLNALDMQTVPKEQWELLVIDNASKESLADTWDLSWHPQARHVRENELGLTAARLRGIQETSSDLLLFVDDDNILAPNFIETLLGLASAYPNLGCFGAGCLEPEFEEQPNLELHPYLSMLALRTVLERQWSNCPTDSITPWGAGLAVRHSIALNFRDAVNAAKTRLHLGRRGQQLNSCEDDEFSWVACQMGLGKGIFPELKIIHLIGRGRVQLPYLLRLAEGHAFSHALLRHLHEKSSPELPGKSDGRNVIQALLRVSPSDFFYEGHRWWSARSRKGVAAEFQKAHDAGIVRARETIKNLELDAVAKP